MQLQIRVHRQQVIWFSIPICCQYKAMFFLSLAPGVSFLKRYRRSGTYCGSILLSIRNEMVQQFLVTHVHTNAHIRKNKLCSVSSFAISYILAEPLLRHSAIQYEKSEWDAPFVQTKTIYSYTQPFAQLKSSPNAESSFLVQHYLFPCHKTQFNERLSVCFCKVKA